MACIDTRTLTVFNIFYFLFAGVSKFTRQKTFGQNVLSSSWKMEKHISQLPNAEEKDL